MTALLPAQIAAMVEVNAPRRSLLLRIGTDPATRLWLGPDDLELDPADEVDPSATYRGAGILLDVPGFRQLTNGKAERVDLSFSATHPAVIAMMAGGVIGAEVDAACIFFNADWSLAGPAAWLWNGSVDVTRSELSEGRRTRVLSIISGAATRAKAGRRYWSNAAHQKRHPGDRLFDRVSGMTINTSRKWPE